MFDDFLKLGPLMGPNTLFGALGQTQDHETNFFILIFISNENPLIWYVTIGMFDDFLKLGPWWAQTHFLGPWVRPRTMKPIFFILIFISNENSLIWYVTVGIFHDFVLLSPQSPPKAPFLGLEQTHDPKTQFLH